MERGGGAVVLGLVVVAAMAMGPATAATQPATDSTVTRIAVAPNGTATWAVQIRTRLTSDADVADYERFQERFRENTSRYLVPFRDRMRGVVADADGSVDRSMRARDFRAETGIQAVPRQWGVVTYEFEWVGFAARDGESVVVGDVFGGQFFLTENDTLEVVGPGGYAVADADPEPAQQESRTVRWFGRRAFADDRPSVRFEPLPTATATATAASTPGSGGPTVTDGRTDGTPDEAGGTGAGDPGTTAPGTSEGGVGDSLLVALAVLTVGILVVGAARYWRSGDAGFPGGTGTSASGTGAAADDGSTGEVGGEPETTAGGASAATGGRTTDAAGTSGAADESGDGGEDGATGIDPDPVVTDRDRVRRLLTEHDGQLRQSEIVDGLDWSKSKTSRVLSDMAEDGVVEKLRIGRENVIRLEAGDDAGEDE